MFLLDMDNRVLTRYG